MNRTGLVIALAVAAVAGLLFALHPELDIAISRRFYDAGGQGFWLRLDRTLGFLRHASMWVIAALAAPAGVALAVKLLLPFRRMLMSGRAVLFLLGTLALGPGLVVNLTMKEHWPRSRPIDVAEFNGDERFVPWWDPRGMCERNCSFVAGESSGAFWTLAPAALAPPPWRALAYTGAVAFGAAVGALRIAFGGHFFSDVVFAGVVIFLIVWVAHGLIYRWPATRLSDAAIEGAIERIGMPMYHAIGAAIRRVVAAARRRRRPGGEVP
jgi:membrane-associated PAP2 superfamily phosphatase